MTTTTPNMSLILPDVSVTAGPQWATLLNAAYALIDSHDHSSGKGALVTPAGINISSDLTFSQHNATDLRTIRLFPNNTFTPVASDKTCLYALAGELYYIDALGNNVQLTLNGAVDVNGAISALTLKDSSFFIQYFGDTSRQFRFNASAIPTATTRILSIPDSGANDTFVTTNATQTLTNKTLTTPAISAINTGSVTFTLPATDGTSGQILQTNGSAVLSFIPLPSNPPANIAANDSNVTFTNASNNIQICTPTAARTYTLPASLTAGVPWTFTNRATVDGRAITLQTSGSNVVAIVPPNGTVIIMPTSATPTTASNWYIQFRESKWTAYTPTATGFGTISGAAGFYKVVGDSLLVKTRWTVGTPSGSTATVAIPTTFVMNSANMITAGNVTIGNVAVNQSSASQFIPIILSTDTSNVYLTLQASGFNGLTNAAGSTVTAAGTTWTMSCEVPI